LDTGTELYETAGGLSHVRLFPGVRPASDYHHRRKQFRLSGHADQPLDSAGNLFFADSGNNRIFRIDTAGNLTAVAGNGLFGYSGDGGPATSAALNGPFGVAVDSSGNIFIADTNNAVVRKVSPGGIITTIAGTGGSSHFGNFVRLRDRGR
jgi:hypothetical protein